MKIVKKLTPYNFTDKNQPERIEYIVVHYFGSLGTAKNVADYFAKSFVGASAHYSVDETDTVYQMVDDGDIAWHCGTSGKYYHPFCRNSNSLGIEVRPNKLYKNSLSAADTDWFFDAATLDNLVDLTKQLMQKYNVPVGKVLRHYDVTHKLCPRPFIENVVWNNFKARLVTAPSHRVKVTATLLNIRSGPGVQYPVTGAIRDKGTYTITSVQGKWGKLKSGKGWIHLDYTTKV